MDLVETSVETRLGLRQSKIFVAQPDIARCVNTHLKMAVGILQNR
jgi:hypothetical protein